MSQALATLSYQGEERQVRWQGHALSNGSAFGSFMQNDVAARLNDEEGTTEFESHLRSLSLTEFGSESLETVLNANSPEERDWAVGEAMAEAWLEKEHQVIWPWNMERDKRNANASLPGADLVGFVRNGSETRLVLGEVKASKQEQFPPNVLYGRSGMIHQIDKLAADLKVINTLLKWLLPRCKNTDYETYFNAAVTLYFNSGNKAVTLFGVLIRDTTPNENDLNGRGKTLGETITSPTTCTLLGLYLPCKIAQLPEMVKGGGAS